MKSAARARNQPFMVIVMVNTNNKKVLHKQPTSAMLQIIDTEAGTYKYLPALSCRPTKKYNMIVKRMSVMAVIGISTSVSASASTKGWYIAARECRCTMGRWTKSAGISAMVESAANRRALAYHCQHA